MTEQPQPAQTSPEPDDWLDALLRQEVPQAALPDNDEFTTRVMAALPPPPTGVRRRWIVPAMALLGCLLGYFWGGLDMSGLSLWLRYVLQLFPTSMASTHALAPLLTTVAALYWLTFSNAWREK